MRPPPLGPTLVAVGAVLAVAFVALVPRWHAPVPGADTGYRGSGMVQFARPADEARAAAPPMPRLPVVADNGRSAASAFRNVQVLTDVNAGDFMRLQHAMTAWVAPKEGCGFCHAPGGDWASDARPQKQAARLMLAMTRQVNAQGAAHTGGREVTCFTCHQGRPVPAAVWFRAPPNPRRPHVDRIDDWNEAAHTVRGFFPVEGFEEYLLQSTPAHGQALTTLRQGTAPTNPEARRVYEAMMQMSDGLGVNCGYCHQSRNFADWGQSTPARWQGHSGIQLTRAINRDWMLKAHAVLRQTREISGPSRSLSLPPRFKGPLPGDAFVECATCHHGAPRLPSTRAGVPGLAPPPAQIASAPRPPEAAR